jgi:hypothetical protein
MNESGRGGCVNPLYDRMFPRPVVPYSSRHCFWMGSQVFLCHRNTRCGIHACSIPHPSSHAHNARVFTLRVRGCLVFIKLQVIGFMPLPSRLPFPVYHPHPSFLFFLFLFIPSHLIRVHGCALASSLYTLCE